VSVLTVAIPLFNGARFLGDAIESLRAQSHRDFRLLCVDDASTDDSVAVAAGHGVEVVTSPAHTSLAANWNRAASLVETETFILAHQDDVYERDFVAAMLGLLDAHPRAFAAHARATAIDERGRAVRNPAARYKDRFWPAAEPVEREPEAEIEVLRQGNYVIAPSVIFRTERFRDLGGFDASLDFVTDWEFWFRGLRRGFTLAGTHARLVRFRRHAATATRVSERTMRRYEEELALLAALEEQRPIGPRRAYRAIANTITTDLAARLADGDRDGARALLRFGRERVPHFAGSARDRLLGTAVAGGTAGGRALKLLERLYILFS